MCTDSRNMKNISSIRIIVRNYFIGEFRKIRVSKNIWAISGTIYNFNESFMKIYFTRDFDRKLTLKFLGCLVKREELAVCLLNQFS